MKTILFLIFSFTSTFAVAQSGQSPDDILLFQHWEGPKSLLNALSKKRTDKCEYLESRLTKFADVKFAVQRILMTMENLPCEKKADHVLKFIGSQDIVLQITAVNLARTLPSAGKDAVSEKILSLKNKDPDLDISISEFIKSKASK